MLKKKGRTAIQAMKNDIEKTMAQPRGLQGRMDPLDIELAVLDARIEKNKAELERNNAKLEAKIQQLLKRLE
jgi:peptidoglycan hydrolase CwlO-like protein